MRPIQEPIQAACSSRRSGQGQPRHHPGNDRRDNHHADQPQLVGRRAQVAGQPPGDLLVAVTLQLPAGRQRGADWANG
jgi:hypothetical protein